MPDTSDTNEPTGNVAGQLLRSCRDQEFIDALKKVLARCQIGGCPTLDQAAELAGISARTLQRRLADQGETYARLAAQARTDFAKQRLVETNLSLAEIASELGFSQSTNFVRAFKRWTGKTPGQHRRSK